MSEATKRKAALKKFRGILQKDKVVEETFRDAFPELAAKLLQDGELGDKNLETLSLGMPAHWDIPGPPVKATK